LQQKSHVVAIRIWISVFIAGLVLSGLMAFPLETELGWLITTLHANMGSGRLLSWLELVTDGVRQTNARYPFLSYGTDWLAFAHLAIAVAFIGPYRDPVRNKWVITFGLIACAGVIPLALIAGSLRQIPLFWRLLDCSFGVLGCVPLLVCRHLIDQQERMDTQYS
jgi:hypothetical protein